MPIPRTRSDLVDSVSTEFEKLAAELRDVDAALADEICIDDWSIKDLLAVRLWWTRSVLNWVGQGLRERVPKTPAAGYRWQETPRLNADIVEKARGRTYRAIVSDLRRQYVRLRRTIDELDDRQLLETGVFRWAGSYPISRWLSINTARQYHTARTYIRRVKRRAE